MAEHTDGEKALYHTVLAARTFIQMGQYDDAATLMRVGATAYQNDALSSTQSVVTGE